MIFGQSGFWKFGNLEIRELEIWKFINLEILEIRKFGNGKIRYTQNNKCYHGCLNTDGTWFQNHFKGEEHFFWEYKPDYIWKKRHSPGIFDTKNANEFCSNCEISQEFSKRKKTHKVYRCLGHDL